MNICASKTAWIDTHYCESCISLNLHSEIYTLVIYILEIAFLHFCGIIYRDF